MNQDNYGSLEACKRLVDAGIILETETVYYQDTLSKEWHLSYKGKTPFIRIASIPAPSMVEAWRELPEYIDIGSNRYRKSIYADGGVTCCWYDGFTASRKKNTNPTDALIDLLILVRKERV